MVFMYRQEGHPVVKALLQYSSLTLLKKECYEEEVQPYRKTDYKPKTYIYICARPILTMHQQT